VSARSVRGSVERARAHLRRIISKGFDRCVHVRPFLHTLPLVYCALRHFRPRRQRRRGSAVIDIPGRCARSFGAAVQSMMMLISGRRKRRLRSFCSLGLVSRPCAQTRRATVHPNFERRFRLLRRTRHGHLQDQKTLGSRLGSLYSNRSTTLSTLTKVGPSKVIGGEVLGRPVARGGDVATSCGGGAGNATA
jgi:hypothetical protein